MAEILHFRGTILPNECRFPLEGYCKVSSGNLEVSSAEPFAAACTGTVSAVGQAKDIFTGRRGELNLALGGPFVRRAGMGAIDAMIGGGCAMHGGIGGAEISQL